MYMHLKLMSYVAVLSLVGVGVSYAQIEPLPDPAADPSLELMADDAIQPLLPAEEMAKEMPAPPATEEAMDIQEIQEAPATPEAGALEAPTPETAAVPDMPGAVAAEEEFSEDLFFDAEALVPTSELSSQGGAPSKVDPALNPGSRLVVARKQYNAGSKEARLVAAERAMKLGRYESALQIYDGLYASNKRDPNVLLGRAVALQRIGDDDGALMAYEELLERRPKNIDAHVNMQGLLSKRYPAVALRNLMELHEQNPGNVPVIAQIAVVEAQMSRYPEAIRYLGVAASMEPNNPNHVFNMAVIADRAGDRKKAIQYYEEALEIDTLYTSGGSVPRESIFERLAQLR